MKHIVSSSSVHFQNAEGCDVYEYPFGDADINGSVIKINGRYPSVGYALNKVCKELVYITQGAGSLGLSNGTQIDFVVGDSLLIEANEKFYWEGDFESYMVCTPAFDPQQHIEVAE